MPGTFFLLLTLATLGAAIRDRHPLSLLAAACLGAVTTQFYPILMVLPAVLGLFLLVEPDSRVLARSVSAWLAAGVFLALWSVPAIWHTSEQPLGFGFMETLSKAHHVFRPGFSIGDPANGNVFLNHGFTPTTVTVAALLGLAVGCMKKNQRYRTLYILVCALVLTLIGFLDGRMNLARLQLAAQPFNAMLAGLGLSWAVGRLPQLKGRAKDSLRLTAGGILLILSVAIWPGPTAKLFTPQLDRRVFAEGIDQVGAGCVLMWPPHIPGYVNSLPTYLAGEKYEKIAFLPLLTTKPSLEIGLLPRECVFYYRPSTCFIAPAGDLRPPDPGEQSQLNDPLCQEIEAQLDLEPVLTRKIPALPDCLEFYRYDQIEVGFFRVRDFKAGISPSASAESPLGTSNPRNRLFTGVVSTRFVADEEPSPHSFSTCLSLDTGIGRL